MARLTAISLTALAGLSFAPVDSFADALAPASAPAAAGASRAADEPNVIGDLLTPDTAHPAPEPVPEAPTPLLPPGAVPIPLPSPAPATAPPIAPPRPLLADNPAPGPGREWSLTASLMMLRDVRYHGHDAGDALVFTAGAVEIRDMRQRAGIPGDGEVGIAAGRADLRSHGDQRVELRVRRLTGTLDVAGLAGVPIQLTATLLPNTPEAAAVQLSELTVRDAVVHVTSTNAAALTLQETHVLTRP